MNSGGDISHLLSLLEAVDSRVRDSKVVVVLILLLAESTYLLSECCHLIKQILQVLLRKLDNGWGFGCHFRRPKHLETHRKSRAPGPNPPKDGLRSRTNQDDE